MSETIRTFWLTSSSETALYKAESPNSVRSKTWNFYKLNGSVLNQSAQAVGGLTSPTDSTWTLVGSVSWSQGESKNASVSPFVLVGYMTAMLGAGSRTFRVLRDGERQLWRTRLLPTGSYVFEKNLGAIGGEGDDWATVHTVSSSDSGSQTRVASDVTVNMLDSIVFG